MGMAASQARFLGLTARKTNVEYEGQQVNQQRTTLANESANYYNQLLGMTVPTPPSSSDFTKTVYTFQDGNLNNKITALVAQADGSYKVSYVQSWTNDFAPVAAGNAVVTKEDGNNYYIGFQKLRQMGADITEDDKKNDPYLSTLSEKQLEDLKKEEKAYKEELNKRYPQAGEEWYVRYVQNTSTGTWSPMFYNKKVVEDAIYTNDTEGTSQSSIPAYKMGSVQETEEIKQRPAKLEKDSTGRYINITIYDEDGANPVTYSLTTNTLTDQDAYDDAMNQYEYDKYQYDQAIQEINAKIEIIQSQDKNLELRLKQLDTEQDAIQTEMEAVQKVIEKNTESTFKTFG